MKINLLLDEITDIKYRCTICSNSVLRKDISILLPESVGYKKGELYLATLELTLICKECDRDKKISDIITP
jgi:hypothetical protein